MKVRRLGEIAFSTDDASSDGVPVILACQLWQTDDPSHRLLMRLEYGARGSTPQAVELKLDYNMARNLTTLLGGVNWLLFAELPDRELRELRAKLNGVAAPTIEGR
jgi:hypothetical protein